MTDGPAPIEQQRILKTAIPGPRSTELHQRKLSAVSAGVSTGLTTVTRARASSNAPMRGSRASASGNARASACACTDP